MRRVLKLPRKWGRLTRFEKRLCFHAVSLMAYYRFTLLTQSFQSLYNSVVLRVGDTEKNQSITGGISRQRLLQIIHYARRVVPCTTCLSEAYAAHLLFTENGFSPVLRIGVKKAPGADLEAHAWITLDGKVVLGALPDLTDYRQILPQEVQGEVR